jgi:hypothetical protein
LNRPLILISQSNETQTSLDFDGFVTPQKKLVSLKRVAPHVNVKF